MIGVLELQQSNAPKIHHSTLSIVAPPHSQEVRVERLGPFLFCNVRRAKLLIFDRKQCIFYCLLFPNKLEVRNGNEFSYTATP